MKNSYFIKFISIVIASILTFSCNAVLFYSNAPQSKLRVYGLTCEYKVNPEVIDAKVPYLAWKLSSDLRGVYQTKYRIMVSTSLENLKNGLYDAWDSGEVKSDKSVAIEYQGKVETAKDYYWRVQVWDNKGNTAISDISKFGVGLLKTEDWDGAKWITNVNRENVEDYIVSMKFNLLSEGAGTATAASLIFGAQDSNNYYMYQITSWGADGGLLLKPHEKRNGSWEVHSSIQIPDNVISKDKQFNSWHTLKLVYSKGEVTTFINDIQIDKREMKNQYSSGYIGFRACLDNNLNESALYDDIKVIQNGETIYEENFNGDSIEEYETIVGNGHAVLENGALRISPTSGEFIVMQKPESYADTSKYTITYDFQLVQSGTGFIFGAQDKRNFYMWQIKEGFGANEGKMFLRPHIWKNGEPSSLGDIDITSALPWKNRYDKHTMKIDVDGGIITTYIDGVKVDERKNMPYTEVGFIGFRMDHEAQTKKGEVAYYDNVKIVDENGKTLYYEDFSNPEDFSLEDGVIVDGRLFAEYTHYKIYWQFVKDNSLPYLRKDFSVKDKEIQRAKIFATALGIYDMYLNGERIGEDYFAPGWTDYDKRVQYQGYDVTKMLAKGKNNVLGVRLAPGWYSGRLGLLSPTQIGNYGDDTAFICKLLIEYDDGSKEVIVSDDTWKYTTSTPMRSSDILDGEYYDARLQIGNSPTAWATLSVDSSEWDNVSILNTKRNLIAQVDPPVQITEELPAKKVWKLSNGNIVVDFGQNFVGVVKINVKGNEGDKIKFIYGEALNTDKESVYTGNLRTAKATDTYVIGSNEVETFMPNFTFHGFRYMEISGLENLDAKNVTGIVLGSNLPRTSTFESSSKLVNQLYSNIIWSQRGNYLSIPTDCPQRDERLGWTGDAQVFVKTGAYNMDIMSFMTKFLTDMRDAQRGDGAFSNVAPIKNLNEYGSHGWGDAGVIIPWTLYHQYGDTRVIEENFEAMEKFIQYYVKTSDNLFFKNAQHGDWLNVNAETDRGLVATAFFAQSTKLVAEMAEILAEKTNNEYYKKSAKYHSELWEDIKKVYVKNFVRNDGSCGNNTQGSYVLSLAFDLVPDNLKQAAADKLVEQINKDGGHITTGFLTVGRLGPVLTKYGYSDVVYKLLTNTSYPSWGYSIERGATTIWERWNSCKDDGTMDHALSSMNSLNHYSFGSIGEWMFSHMLGIDWGGETPAYKDFVLKPNPSNNLSIDMTFARGTYESINGTIKSEWYYEKDGTLVYKVSVPANTTATLYLPIEKGNKVYESGVLAHKSEGVTFKEEQDGTMVYKLSSGSYVFKQVKSGDITEPNGNDNPPTGDWKNVFGVSVLIICMLIMGVISWKYIKTKIDYDI